MDQPAITRAPRAPAFSRTHRLVLAGAAAGTVLTLCWAALQVRAAREEIRQLRAQPPAASATAADTAELGRRLADAAARAQKAESESALRTVELEKVIEFLRQENAAAQQTIERLSRAGPREEPVQTGADGAPRTPE